MTEKKEDNIHSKILKVVKLPDILGAKNCVIHERIREILNLSLGDVIEINNILTNKKSVGILLDDKSTNLEKNQIGISKTMRRNINCNLGMKVSIKKIKAKRAKEITFSGVGEWIILRNEKLLAEKLNNVVVTKYDILFFYAYGNEVGLAVISYKPDCMAVIIGKNSKITINTKKCFISSSYLGKLPSFDRCEFLTESEISRFLRSFYYNLHIIENFYEIKTNEIKLNISLSEKNIFNKLAPYEKEKEDLYYIEKDDSIIEYNSKDLELYQELTKDLTYENLLKHENRFYLLSLYNEMEQYLFKSLKYAIMKHPEIIGDKSVLIKDLIQKEVKIKLIIEEKIEKKLNNLFFQPFEEIFEYIYNKISIKHKISQNNIKKLEDFKQYRNLYTHGDGIVNHLFLSKVNISDLDLGDELILNRTKLDEFINLVCAVLDDFDKSLLKAYPELI